MKKEQWKEIIKKNCIDIGTYNEAFDSVISSLADILEKRDSIMESYDGNPVVEHTNSHGETNNMKNPSIMLWMDCNKLALAYWRELGLTPSGVRKINESVLKEDNKKMSALEEALKKLSSG